MGGTTVTEKLARIVQTNYRRQEGPLAMFSRDDNGMIIAAADNAVTKFGEDPQTPEIRFFSSHEYALDYAKSKCREYCGREDVDFLQREGEPMVVPANTHPNNLRRM